MDTQNSISQETQSSDSESLESLDLSMSSFNTMMDSTTITRGEEEEEEDEEERFCYICHQTEEFNCKDEVQNLWVKPCKCRGELLWVHTACLNRFIDVKIQSTTWYIPHCEICGTCYSINKPEPGRFTRILYSIDKKFISQSFINNDFAFKTAEWFHRFTSWEAPIIRAMRHYHESVKSKPFLRFFLPNPYKGVDETVVRGMDYYEFRKSFYRTRVIQEMLLTLQTGYVFGCMRLLSSNLSIKRFLLGSLSLIVFRGFFKIFLSRDLIISRTKRRILNYSPRERLNDAI